MDNMKDRISYIVILVILALLGITKNNIFTISNLIVLVGLILGIVLVIMANGKRWNTKYRVMLQVCFILEIVPAYLLDKNLSSIIVGIVILVILLMNIGRIIMKNNIAA